MVSSFVETGETLWWSIHFITSHFCRGMVTSSDGHCLCLLNWAGPAAIHTMSNIILCWYYLDSDISHTNLLSSIVEGEARGCVSALPQYLRRCLALVVIATYQHNTLWRRPRAVPHSPLASQGVGLFPLPAGEGEGDAGFFFVLPAPTGNGSGLRMWCSGSKHWRHGAVPCPVQVQ